MPVACCAAAAVNHYASATLTLRETAAAAAVVLSVSLLRQWTANCSSAMYTNINYQEEQTTICYVEANTYCEYALCFVLLAACNSKEPSYYCPVRAINHRRVRFRLSSQCSTRNSSGSVLSDTPACVFS
eukprot:4470-Heterococcus_DN1.PRE.3